MSAPLAVVIALVSITLVGVVITVALNGLSREVRRVSDMLLLLQRTVGRRDPAPGSED